MARPSQILANLYDLQLSAQWQGWLDQNPHELILPGCFRFPVDVNELTQAKPSQLWAGFMLPDTLPLLGNGYGDWICARVTERDELGELIHWYHGGGDWIPVGNSIGEAILHDVVDMYRPKQKQMLRGAVESIVPEYQERTDRSQSAQFFQWILEHFGLFNSAHQVELVLQTLQDQGYIQALEQLAACGIAIEASTCDLIEHKIGLALPVDQMPLSQLPESDLRYIEVLCSQITNRRTDLGWSIALAGWSQLNRGHKDLALNTFFAGRYASAFSDQSVRLKLHRFEQEYGKFSIAQLASMQSEFAPEHRADDYLNAVFTSSNDGLIGSVQSYWERQAEQAKQQGDYAAAYDCYYRSGWDLGATHMADYRRILAEMGQAAENAGWVARARLARAHLRCL